MALAYNYSTVQKVIFLYNIWILSIKNKQRTQWFSSQQMADSVEHSNTIQCQILRKHLFDAILFTTQAEQYWFSKTYFNAQLSFFSQFYYFTNYKLNSTVHCCLQEKAPRYPGWPLRTSFRSRRLSTTRFSQSTTPYCATALPAEHIQVSGLFSRMTLWNSLPDSLCDPTLSSNSF